MKSVLGFLASLFFIVGLQAQHFTYKVEQRNITEAWITDPGKMNDEFEVSVKHLEGPIPGGSLNKEQQRELKKLVSEEYPRTLNQALSAARSSSDSLTIEDSFTARFFFNNTPLVGGQPSDHTLAISDDNKLLASYNSQLWGYDLEADTFLFQDNAKHPSFVQFLNFYADSTFSLNNPFDPKLFYHPEYDRFVFLFLTGREPSNSGTVVSFSSTNNPADEWYSYFLSGNPLDDNTWTDFPQIAFNGHSMYLTLNQLYPDSGWVEGFVYSVCWQLDLEGAFAGVRPLPTKIWSDLNYDNEPIRYLRPANTGLGPESDSMFFIGNRPFDIQNDTFFLLRMEGDVNDLSTNANAVALQTDVPYGYPPYAIQPDGHLFWTNDARALGAVRFGNELHWVGNTLDPASGGVGIYHGVITDLANPSITGNIIKHPTRDLGFPNICYMGKNPGDNEVAIFFNHTSATAPAGNSIVFYDQNREYGPIQTLQTGTDPVDRQTTLEERWGDYTGIQRKYNESQRMWVAGYRGITGNRNGIWITELSGPDDWPLSVRDSEPQKDLVVVYPNPTADRVSVQFSVTDGNRHTEVSLFDGSGKLVKVLARGTLKPGDHELSFTMQSLPAGNYNLVIQSGGEALLTEQIVRQ